MYYTDKNTLTEDYCKCDYKGTAVFLILNYYLCAKLLRPKVYSVHVFLHSFRKSEAI